MTKKGEHHFLNAPEHLCMREAVRYGQVMPMVRDSEIALRILRSRVNLDFSNDSVWLPFLEMWFGNPVLDKRSSAMFETVVDYLWVICQLNGPGAVRLRSRTRKSLIRSALHFFTGLARKRDGTESTTHECYFDEKERSLLLRFQADVWEPFEGVIPFEKQARGWYWKMVELTSHRELDAEGRDMNHCVRTYAGDCEKGISSIFSLRSRRLHEGMLDREVTIEVDRRERRLLQVKAWRNRRPHPLTRKIVIEWCETNNIESGAWSIW
ncbi:MAG: PcfJ domain-containing protein [Verrucomicrobiales bacterium]|nr:PcfJ domain-containing protein [Verrucomicrobiales bacterium]